MTDIKRKMKPSQKSIFLKSGSMVAGANKVFCGTENGVCELTKDTVYVHPSAKQCSWTPSANSVFSPVVTFGSGEYVKFTLSNITTVGMYYLQWRFQLTNNRYLKNVLKAHMTTTGNLTYDCYIHSTGIPNNTSRTYEISVWINVTFRSEYVFAMVIDGTGIEASGNDAFKSISLGLAVGSNELYNGNSTSTVNATLYRLSLS